MYHVSTSTTFCILEIENIKTKEQKDLVNTFFQTIILVNSCTELLAQKYLNVVDSQIAFPIICNKKKTKNTRHKRHLRIRPQTIDIHPQPRAKPLASHDARQRRPQPLRPTLCMPTAHTLSVWDIIRKQKQWKLFLLITGTFITTVVCVVWCMQNKGCSLLTVLWLLW